MYEKPQSAWRAGRPQLSSALERSQLSFSNQQISHFSRPARPHRFTVPSRSEVAEHLRELIRNPAAREATAEWASEYIVFDEPQLYPRVEDPVVSEMLQRLSAVDLPSTDRRYLYAETDFVAWLEELLGR